MHGLFHRSGSRNPFTLPSGDLIIPLFNNEINLLLLFSSGFADNHLESKNRGSDAIKKSLLLSPVLALDETLTFGLEVTKIAGIFQNL